MEHFLLAGDIGGTKANLVVVAAEGSNTRIVADTTLPSRSYGSLPELITEFLAKVIVPVTLASFSVAGPVVRGRALLPNLGWRFGREELRAEFDFLAVSVVNDLEATARAIPQLSADQILTIQPGELHARGPKGVIAPGTGLGEALLIPNGPAEYVVLPSEGGHADFAPTTAEQLELLRFLQAESGRVSYENVCSGNGIVNIHRFLRATGRAEDSPDAAMLITAAADPAPRIVEAGLCAAAPSTASARALEIFADVLAAEAGNLALRGMTTGGVFIGGGLPPRMVGLLRNETFICVFRQKGPMSDLVRTIPLHLILDPRTALLGAIRYGLDMLETVTEQTAIADAN
jgi:glucokinase